MAIQTVDELTAGLQSPVEVGKDASTAEAVGVLHTLWYTSGVTGAGAAPTGGLNGAVFTGPSVAGQIPFPAAVAGQRVYLAHLEVTHTGNIGAVQLVDRLWGNVPVVTTTTSQAVVSPTWPARDAAGATAGLGVFLALEVSSATGNASPLTTITATYTNSSGTGSRTATCASFPATAVAGTRVVMSLQAGDVGVRSVQAFNLGGTSLVSGAIHLVAYRHLARIGVPAANISYDRDWLQLGRPWVPDTAVPSLVVVPTSTSPGAVSAAVTWAQG